jgi:hypothetical protein
VAYGGIGMHDIITHPYTLIGIVVYAVFFKKMARGFAKTRGRFLVTYDMRGPHDPRFVDYFGALLWGPCVIGLWPLFIFLYFEG